MDERSGKLWPPGRSETTYKNLRNLRIEKRCAEEYDGSRDIDNNQEKPTVICRLLDNLNYCIDEERVSDSISRLNLEIGKIESTSGPSKRTLLMRHEVERLESLLNYSRRHTELRHSQHATPSVRTKD